MGRIQKAYETRLRWLLAHVGARQLDKGVRWWLDQAQGLSQREHVSLNQALTRRFETLACKRPFAPVRLLASSERFLCDAGLGGLARWLRAAGYEALWQADIGDDELLRQARVQGATILTTDSMLMERRLVRDRLIPAFWLPPTLEIPEQLSLVFREFGLVLRAPRCMACGGCLRAVEKEALRDRIPPRTYRWLNDFFVCQRCDQLFWHGTHWQRIRDKLEQTARTESSIRNPGPPQT